MIKIFLLTCYSKFFQPMWLPIKARLLLCRQRISVKRRTLLVSINKLRYFEIFTNNGSDVLDFSRTIYKYQYPKIELNREFIKKLLFSYRYFHCIEFHSFNIWSVKDILIQNNSTIKQLSNYSVDCSVIFQIDFVM